MIVEVDIADPVTITIGRQTSCVTISKEIKITPAAIATVGVIEKEPTLVARTLRLYPTR